MTDRKAYLVEVLKMVESADVEDLVFGKERVQTHADLEEERIGYPLRSIKGFAVPSFISLVYMYGNGVKGEYWCVIAMKRYEGINISDSLRDTLCKSDEEARRVVLEECIRLVKEEIQREMSDRKGSLEPVKQMLESAEIEDLVFEAKKFKTDGKFAEEFIWYTLKSIKGSAVPRLLTGFISSRYVYRKYLYHRDDVVNDESWRVTVVKCYEGMRIGRAHDIFCKSDKEARQVVLEECIHLVNKEIQSEESKRLQTYCLTKSTWEEGD